MKKSLLLIGPILFSLALQGGAKYLLISEKLLTKTIQFSIYTDADYSFDVYKNSNAMVELSVWKFTTKDPELLWCDTVNAGNLKYIPSEADQLYREVSIHNVKDSKEVLVANYKVIYESRGGSKLSYDKGFVVEKGPKPKQVRVLM